MRSRSLESGSNPGARVKGTAINGESSRFSDSFCFQARLHCMKRIVLLAGLTVAAVSAHAQVTPFTINVSYGRTNTFDLNGGGSGYIAGAELSVAQSILKLPFIGEARVGASALFGNSIMKGPVDGTVYRLFAWYKTPMAGPNGMYGLGGFSYATAQSRGGAFDNASGIGFDFGIGIPLSMGGVGKISRSALEFVYHQGSKAQTRGIMVGMSFQF